MKKVRVWILTLICAILTGCGSFKRSKRIDHQLDIVEVSQDVKIKTETTAEKENKSVAQETKKKQSEESIKVYPTPGKPVIVLSDGSITGELDSIISNVRRQSNEGKNMVNSSKETSQKRSNGAISVDSTWRYEQHHHDQLKEPSAKGTISHWIGMAIGAVILLAFLAFSHVVRYRTRC